MCYLLNNELFYNWLLLLLHQLVYQCNTSYPRRYIQLHVYLPSKYRNQNLCETVPFQACIFFCCCCCCSCCCTLAGLPRRRHRQAVCSSRLTPPHDPLCWRARGRWHLQTREACRALTCLSIACVRLDRVSVILCNTSFLLHYLAQQQSVFFLLH